MVDSIFIIDDDINDRELIARQLRLGHTLNHLEMIESGENALIIFQQIADGVYPHMTPALIILDLNFLGMPGEAILRAIRAVDAIKLCPVMVLTGRQDFIAGMSAEDMQPLAIVRKGNDMLDMKHFFDAFLELQVGWLLVASPESTGTQ